MILGPQSRVPQMLAAFPLILYIVLVIRWARCQPVDLKGEQPNPVHKKPGLE